MSRTGSTLKWRNIFLQTQNQTTKNGRIFSTAAGVGNLSPLHSNKINDEKNAFVSELLSRLPSEEELTTGSLALKARRLHASFLPLHIIKHFTPESKELRSTYFPALMSHA